MWLCVDQILAFYREYCLVILQTGFPFICLGNSGCSLFSKMKEKNVKWLKPVITLELNINVQNIWKDEVGESETERQRPREIRYTEWQRQRDKLRVRERQRKKQRQRIHCLTNVTFFSKDQIYKATPFHFFFIMYYLFGNSYLS